MKIINNYTDFISNGPCRAILVLSYRYSDRIQYEYHRISWVEMTRKSPVGQWIITYKNDNDGYKFKCKYS